MLSLVSLCLSSCGDELPETVIEPPSYEAGAWIQPAFSFIYNSVMSESGDPAFEEVPDTLPEQKPYVLSPGTGPLHGWGSPPLVDERVFDLIVFGGIPFKGVFLDDSPWRPSQNFGDEVNAAWASIGIYNNHDGKRKADIDCFYVIVMSDGDTCFGLPSYQGTHQIDELGTFLDGIDTLMEFPDVDFPGSYDSESLRHLFPYEPFGGLASFRMSTERTVPDDRYYDYEIGSGLIELRSGDGKEKLASVAFSTHAIRSAFHHGYHYYMRDLWSLYLESIPPKEENPGFPWVIPKPS